MVGGGCPVIGRRGGTNRGPGARAAYGGGAPRRRPRVSLPALAHMGRSPGNLGVAFDREFDHGAFFFRIGQAHRTSAGRAWASASASAPLALMEIDQLCKGGRSRCGDRAPKWQSPGVLHEARGGRGSHGMSQEKRSKKKSRRSPARAGSPSKNCRASSSWPRDIGLAFPWWRSASGGRVGPTFAAHHHHGPPLSEEGYWSRNRSHSHDSLVCNSRAALPVAGRRRRRRSGRKDWGRSRPGGRIAADGRRAAPKAAGIRRRSAWRSQGRQA